MPQVMQTVMRVVATGLPSQLLTQRLQGIQNAGLISGMAVIAQEEPVADGSGYGPVTPPSIGVQGLGYARMKWHQALPVEFGFSDTENASIEVDIGACQRQRFGDA